MKWKLYQLCSLYNMTVSAIYACLLLYYFFRDNPKDGASFVLILIVPLVSVSIKNRMGIRLLQFTRDRQTHRDRFGLAFVFLWIFNIICFIALAWLMYEYTSKFAISNLVYRNFIDAMIAISLYLGLFTMPCTLLFDMQLERRVRKQPDISSELLHRGDAK